MRIAMTSYYLPSESKIGAGYMAHRLAQVLVERGHTLTMFSPCTRPDDATYHHIHIPMTGTGRTFRWALRVRDLDLRGFDIMHAHGENHLRLGRKTKQIRTLHGSCFAEAVHIRGAKARTRMVALGVTEILGSLVADRTVAVSQNTRTYYPWVNDVIPNGVDLDRFHPGAKEDCPTVLFVGTYLRRKRGRLLMEAFEREVLPALPDARLWMVCSDAPKALNVDVLGTIDDDELADRYRRAWVFCLPSSYEGFGVPYIEAMASGTPVVATPNVGALEVLDRGRCGLIAKPQELGQALIELLTKPVRRAEYTLKGLGKSRGYDRNRVAEAYEQLYEEVLDGRRPSTMETDSVA